MYAYCEVNRTLDRIVSRAVLFANPVPEASSIDPPVLCDHRLPAVFSLCSYRIKVFADVRHGLYGVIRFDLDVSVLSVFLHGGRHVCLRLIASARIAFVYDN